MNLLRKVQLTQIDMLNKFVEICAENNLCYFFIGGTLLGTVLYKGFIPWDDDIDIAMPREDYNRFLDISQKLMGSNYIIDCSKTNKDYYLAFAKVRKKNTIYEQEFQKNYNGNKGIWIDIFPIDHEKKDKSISQDIRFKLIKYLRRVVLFRNNFYLNKKYLPFKKLLGAFFSNFKNSTLLKFGERIMSVNKNTKSKYFVNWCTKHHYSKATIEKSKIFPLKKLYFEGKLYNVPNDYNYVLEKNFGNYLNYDKKKIKNHPIHNPINILLEDNYYENCYDRS